MINDFYNIEGKQLDKEQIESVEYIGNQLVIAGAGSGKTLSIVGKIKYLLDIKKVEPSDILLLAFTDKVVDELKERVGKITKSKIDILTFHKLGLKIFKLSNEKIYNIDENAFYKFLWHYFYDGQYEKDIATASLVYNFVNKKYDDYDLVDLSNIKELTNNINKVTFNGEKANSVIALIVCNMLYVNNIKYEYIVENRYSHYIKINDKIIHFTKKISLPNYLSLKNIDMKLITQYVYNFLKRSGISINSYYNYKRYLANPSLAKNFEEFFEALEEAQKIASGADAYEKNIDYLIEEFCQEKPCEKMFLKIFNKIRREFANYLKETYKTDFNYMIEGPIKILSNRGNILKYKYIIVDEYQDISPARFNLLKEILEQNNGYLMAYGDDWQAIYSFSGSNNKFFMDFKENLSNAKEFYLKNTYRNSQQLINASAKFIEKNPCQKNKEIFSKKSLDKPIKILNYSVSNADSLIYALDYIKENEKDNEVSLMILGRTNYAINMINNLAEFKLFKEEDNKKIYVFKGYPTIHIQFLTIHRAKGLEADYIFVTGVNDKDMPLEVNKKKEYVSIINKLNEYEEEKEHEKYEGLPSSEERRLFYVALTRAKKNVFLSAPNMFTLNRSRFIDDLMIDSENALENIEIPKLYENKTEICPECGGITYSVSKKGRKYCFCENKCRLNKK